jgi:signal transduction histidine kinase
VLTPDGGRFDPERRGFAMTREGVAMHASTAPLTHDGRRWYVQFATSDRLVARMRESFSLPALEQGIAAICLTFFVIFLVTIHVALRRALQPLRVASDAARDITPRTLDARLDADAQPIEIKPLVEGFNQALDRLQQGFRTQQEFLSHAAHELKTPLALIRAQVERIGADDRSRILLQDVDHMARQVQQLLLLAEVSEPRNFRIESIDPRSSIQEVFDYMTRVAEKRTVYLGLRISPSVRQWQVDRGGLFTLLKNLLENAIQHSPTGGIVTLSVSADRLSVLDQGPGIPAEHLPLIFDRFWRGAARREDGAGLGLAICHEIALAHGWRLQARNHDRGLEVVAEMKTSSEPPVRADGSGS